MQHQLSMIDNIVNSTTDLSNKSAVIEIAETTKKIV